MIFITEKDFLEEEKQYIILTGILERQERLFQTDTWKFM